jgi:hypothetical protein
MSVGDHLHGDPPVVFDQVEGLAVDDELQDSGVPATLGSARREVVDEESEIFDFSGELRRKFFGSFFESLDPILSDMLSSSS